MKLGNEIKKVDAGASALHSHAGAWEREKGRFAFGKLSGLDTTFDMMDNVMLIGIDSKIFRC
jgi:hypothetical protein